MCWGADLTERSGLHRGAECGECFQAAAWCVVSVKADGQSSGREAAAHVLKKRQDVPPDVGHTE